MKPKVYTAEELIGKRIRILQDMPYDVGFTAGMIVVVSCLASGHTEASQSAGLYVRPDGKHFPEGVSDHSGWWIQSWREEQHTPDNECMWELVMEEKHNLSLDLFLTDEELDSLKSSKSFIPSLRNKLSLAVEAYYEA